MTEAGGKTAGKSRAVLGFLRAPGSREGGPGEAAMPARPCRWRAADADAWPGRVWPWVPAQPRLGRAGPAPLAAKWARRRPGERGCCPRPNPGPSPSSLPRQPGWLRWLRWPRSCAALQPEPPGWEEGWVAPARSPGSLWSLGPSRFIFSTLSLHEKNGSYWDPVGAILFT